MTIGTRSVSGRRNLTRHCVTQNSSEKEKKKQIKKCSMEDKKNSEYNPGKFSSKIFFFADLPQHERNFLRDGMALDFFPSFHFFSHNAFYRYREFIRNSASRVDHPAAANANNSINFV